MGAGQSELGLPHRVNIVYGGRFALAKLGRGNCPAEAVAAHALLASPQRRVTSSNKWFLRSAGRERDADGSATVCTIRNDWHPQRFLCASHSHYVEVRVEGRPEGTGHLWEIEYLHDHLLRTDSVKPPFHLRSLSRPEKPYLVVDPSSGTVRLQGERPSTLWQLFDSTGSTASLRVSYAHTEDTHDCEGPMMSRAVSAVLQDWQLLPVLGSMEDVLAARPQTQDGTRAYSGPDALFAIGQALCDPVEIARPPYTLYGVYLALLGQDSAFRHRLCDGAQPQVVPVQRVESQPGCGVAAAKCLASVPVLGKRTYEETLRVALCTDGRVNTLAIQVAGKLRIGFPVGDFLTETLHLFTQVGDCGPVLLQSWGLAQPGAQQQRALDGMKSKQLDYLEGVRQSIRETSPAVLQSAKEPRVAERSPTAEGSPRAEPSPCDASSASTKIPHCAAGVDDHIVPRPRSGWSLLEAPLERQGSGCFAFASFRGLLGCSLPAKG